MSVSLDIQDANLQKAFDGLKVGKLRTAMRSGLRKAMGPVKSAVWREYKAAYPGSNRYRIVSLKNYKRGIGVWLGLHKVRPTDAEVQTLIALRTLNRGAEGRATKKGYNRGDIQGSQFFDNAVSGAMGAAEAKAQREVTSAIMKKAQKEGLV